MGVPQRKWMDMLVRDDDGLSTSHIIVPNIISSSNRSLVDTRSEKEMVEKIVEAYISDMNEVFQKYKRAVKDEVELLSLSDQDGSIIRKSLPRGTASSEYWLEEYRKLKEDFDAHKFVTKITVEKRQPQMVQGEASVEPPFEVPMEG